MDGRDGPDGVTDPGKRAEVRPNWKERRGFFDRLNGLARLQVEDQALHQHDLAEAKPNGTVRVIRVREAPISLDIFTASANWLIRTSSSSREHAAIKNKKS